MDYKFAFFGTDEFSVIVLDEMEKDGLLPSVIVCPPDKPQGRGLAITPPPIKKWAAGRNLAVLQPEKLDSDFAGKLSAVGALFFVVASYGKIIPKSILNLAPKGVLNVHPSLLPKYRGPSPVESQILNSEKEVGVSIMILDEEMDHGPILGEEKLIATAMPMPAGVLYGLLASLGGRLLAGIIPKWLSSEIKAAPQDHSKATLTKKITREDGLVDSSGDNQKNYLKYLAYGSWPGTYFFADRKGEKMRVKITEAVFADNKFTIKKVIPEGGREMNYEDFQRGT